MKTDKIKQLESLVEVYRTINVNYWVQLSEAKRALKKLSNKKRISQEMRQRIAQGTLDFCNDIGKTDKL